MEYPKKLIHYGSKSFDPLVYKEVENSEYNIKPYKGGLWTSPIDSDLGWIDYCNNTFDPDSRHCVNVDVHFKVTLKDNLNVLKIDSRCDLLRAPLFDIKWPLNSIRGIFQKSLDFEKIAESYDAIWLTVNGLYANERFHEGQAHLFTWDCETVLILNKDAIIL